MKQKLVGWSVNNKLERMWKEQLGGYWVTVLVFIWND